MELQQVYDSEKADSYEKLKAICGDSTELEALFCKRIGNVTENTPTSEPSSAANTDGKVYEVPHAVMQDESTSFARMGMSTMDIEH